jgi:hypothetical protein
MASKHSPAAMIAARTNHAPQLAPVRKSPIAAPMEMTAPTSEIGSWVEIGAVALVCVRERPRLIFQMCKDYELIEE